ncbi:unnamed protein product [Rotaria sordida]|uniref:Uncharacterized protein n=1 Tax=Rotaria sordida TaxID=392033 RepID=A0A815NKE3_9BILA|nr:unnamed protein product [Rotaria sordida]
MKQETSAEPFITINLKENFVDNSYVKISQSKTWIGHIDTGVAAAASIYGLAVLIILLAVPIALLVIGSLYHDPRYCPIEPRISLFLIVSGSVILAVITLIIIISILTIFFAPLNSLKSRILPFILSIIILIGIIFSFIWLIIGSVWIFRVNKWVTHEYDIINNFYTYNYCHPVLYRFTFVYLILAYIFMVITCAYQCFFKYKF